MILAKIPRELWLSDYAQNAHMAVFGHEYPEYDTTLFDYVLVVIDKASNTPIIYNMIRMLKKDMPYIEYGGSFPAFRGSSKVRKAFVFLLEQMKEHGMKTVTLMTAAENVAMQKLALAVGFRVFGVTMGRYGLCLEYRLILFEKEKDNESMVIDGNIGGSSSTVGSEPSSAEKETNAISSGADKVRAVDGT